MSLSCVRSFLGAILGLAGIVLLAGCETTPRQVKLVRHFVPPAPAPLPPTPEVEPPPALDSLLIARELPHLFEAAGPASQHVIEVEMRLRRAQDRFREGAAMMARGEADSARVEFDRALGEMVTASVSLPGRSRLEQRYRQMLDEIHRLEVESAAATDADPVFDRTPLEDIVPLTFPIEPGLKGKVKEQLQSTVSQLPLEMADPVLGFINYFSTPRGRKILEAGLRRQGRYAPMIRRILDEEGLPKELIFLAQAESGFLPRAVSSKRATGMWQFIKYRGIEYGLKQTLHTDDRLDPEKATRAAARHLRDLYAEFGDWYLAVAAYNCGPLNVTRAVERTGYADFWEMYNRNVIPRETANYLPIILAMTIMAKNPKDYGLEDIPPDPGLDYDTIRLAANTHMALIADLAQRPLSLIREMNPAVLKLVAPSGYEIHIPKGAARAVLAALEGIPAEKRVSWRVHRMESHDTVASIARQYRIGEKAIQDANRSRLAEPQAGDLLLIPVSYPGVEMLNPVRKGQAGVRSQARPQPKAATKPPSKPVQRASAMPAPALRVARSTPAAH